MNYLVTHYKNLAEQLQSRINHIQQCLYEMDEATPPPRPLPYAQEMTPSRRDDASLQYSQYTPGYNAKNNEYNPNNPFWNTPGGQLWRQNWERLQAAMRNPNNLTRSMTEYLEQNGFENLEAYRQFLINQARQNGVVPPPLGL